MMWEADVRCGEHLGTQEWCSQQQQHKEKAPWVLLGAGPGAGVPAAALHLHTDTPLLPWRPSVLYFAQENQPQSGSNGVKFGGEQAPW